MSSWSPSPGRPRRRRAESSCAQGAQVGCGQERKNSQNNPKCQNKGGRGFVLTGEAEGQNKNMIAVIAARFHFPRRRQRSVVVGLGCQFVKLRIPGLRERSVVLVQCVKILLRSPKGARGAQKTRQKTWENVFLVVSLNSSSPPPFSGCPVFSFGVRVRVRVCFFLLVLVGCHALIPLLVRLLARLSALALGLLDVVFALLVRGLGGSVLKIRSCLQNCRGPPGPSLPY